MPDAAHGGGDWEPREQSMLKDLGTIWAACGISSECGSLKKVLLHRPGKEVENISDPAKILWNSILNPDIARKQHDYLADFYRSLGIQVLYVDDGEQSKPNLYFMRDLFTMTPFGAIIARPASKIRAGEERIAANSLIKNGIPIILSVHGSGVFEGPDLVFVNETLAFLGLGLRSNLDGINQITRVLNSMGIDTILIQTTYGCGHLDGVFNIIDRKKAILYPTRVSYTVYERLKSLGFDILELPDPNEAAHGMAINMVSITPGSVVMPSGNPNTRKYLEKKGVQCYEVDVSELMKGGGAVHCMTGIIQRDSL